MFETINHLGPCVKKFKHCHLSIDELVAESNKYIVSLDEFSIEMINELNKSIEPKIPYLHNMKNNNTENLTVDFINNSLTKKLNDLETKINEIDLFKYENNRINNLDEDQESIAKSINSIVCKNCKYLDYLREVNDLKLDMKDLIKQTDKFRHICLDLENRIRILENTSKNGSFIWKIENIKEKLIESKSNRLAFIDSNSFYTSNYGYKMCVRLYLNGDGSGKGTHLSIFFILMKGEYDCLLKWPFRQYIRFILMDQNLEVTNDVNESFRPDPNSMSYRRPNGQMNVASGLPLFCSHKKLFEGNFVKDNTIFIKTIVDLSNITYM